MRQREAAATPGPGKGKQHSDLPCSVDQSMISTADMSSPSHVGGTWTDAVPSSSSSSTASCSTCR